MKKKLLLLLLIVSSVITANGQAILTYSSYPVEGDVFNSFLVDASGITPGAGGAGVTWDFSALINTGQTETDSFKLAGDTPYWGTYTGSTLCTHIVSPVINNYIYYSETDTTIENRGNSTPSGFLIHYTQPETEYKFPFTYGNTYSSNYIYSYSSGSSLVHGTGTLTATGDGYGMLTTPLGTYNDAERITYVHHESDTTETELFLRIRIKDVTSTKWYQASEFFPLLSITETTSGLLGSIPDTSRSVMYSSATAIPPTSTGINEFATNDLLKASIFPNPATDNVTLHCILKEKNILKISICNLVGEKVFSAIENQDAGAHSYKINTGGFAGGVYFYSVETNTHRTDGKLIILN